MGGNSDPPNLQNISQKRIMKKKKNQQSLTRFASICMFTVTVTVVREENLYKLFFLNGSTFYLAELANWLPCGVSLGLADKVFDVHLHVLQRVMESQLFCFTRRRATFHLNYGHTLVTCSLHLQALCVIIA